MRISLATTYIGAKTMQRPPRLILNWLRHRLSATAMCHPRRSISIQSLLSICVAMRALDRRKPPKAFLNVALIFRSNRAAQPLPLAPAMSVDLAAEPRIILFLRRIASLWPRDAAPFGNQASAGLRQMQGICPTPMIETAPAEISPAESVVEL